MKWYDFFAGFYDSALEKLYFETRQRAVAILDLDNGHTVLDVACGTGANFPHLFANGKRFQLYATDFSAGMLKKAGNRVQQNNYTNVHLFQADARDVTPATIEKYAGKQIAFDRIVCVLGLSVMPDWKDVLDNLTRLLAAEGKIVIVDVFAEKRTMHTWLVEKIARADLSRPIVERLQEQTNNFSVEYQPIKESKVGGKLFVAAGNKSRESP